MGSFSFMLSVCPSVLPSHCPLTFSVTFGLSSQSRVHAVSSCQVLSDHISEGIIIIGVVLQLAVRHKMQKPHGSSTDEIAVK